MVKLQACVPGLPRNLSTAFRFLLETSLKHYAGTGAVNSALDQPATRPHSQHSAPAGEVLWHIAGFLDASAVAVGPLPYPTG